MEKRAESELLLRMILKVLNTGTTLIIEKHEDHM